MATLTEMAPYRTGEGRTLLYIEVPIPPALEGPFLVTGAKAPFLWVRKFPTNFVRAAVRRIPWEFLHREALEHAAERALAAEWGNCLPPTAEGLQAALAHFEEYQIPKPYEFLYGDGFDKTMLQGIEDISAQEVTWVPTGWGVLLPEDRAYLGTTFDLGVGNRALVLHNASRGICILRPPPPAPSEAPPPEEEPPPAPPEEPAES